MFQENDPSKHTFILRWKNKLDISDAQVNIVRNPKLMYKELVFSYKTIFMNTFTVSVIDISSIQNFAPIFRHESF